MRENKKGESGEKVIEIPSTLQKKMRTRGVISVDFKNIPKEERENLELVVGYIEKNNRTALQEEAEKGPKRKKRVVMVATVAVAAMLGLNLVTDTERTVETVSTPISGIYYHIDNPAEASWALVNAVGQEEMTNISYLKKQKEEDRVVSIYDADTQVAREKSSLADYEQFVDLQFTIAQNIAILRNPDVTQKELKQAIAVLKDASSKVQKLLESNQELVQKAGEGFERNAKVLLDDRTEGEITVKNDIVNRYNAEVGLSQYNLEFVEEMERRMEMGETVSFHDFYQELDGDYIINGESSHEVVNERTLRGIDAILSRMTKWFSRGKTTQTQEQQTKDETSQNENEER
ncbi:MAG: hypothetical protein IJ867_06815 [Clostridia bacterium]|nr:hypothetical protein [Clostridia bacterium]